MAVYIVTYDLKKPGKDYDELIKAIKAYGSYCHCQGSVWFIDFSWTAAQIRDDLKKHIDSNDELFVGRLSSQWASWGTSCGDWLNSPQRNW